MISTGFSFEFGCQVVLQILIKLRFGREFGFMIAAFTLREIAVDDGHIAERGRNFRHDDAALRLFIVTREATTHRHRRIFGQQRNAVVAFLTVVKTL